MRLLLISLFLLTACNKEAKYLYEVNYPKQQKFNKLITLKEISSSNEIDIVWIVDNSGSMSGIQKNIITNAQLFMQEFSKLKYIHWKVGVLSSDIGDSPYLGFSSNFDYTHLAPVPVFQNAIQSLGTNGDYHERLLTSLKLNLDKYPNFLRPGAAFAAILVTDEEPQGAVDNIEILNYLTTTKNIPMDQIRFYGAIESRDLCPQGYYWNYAGSIFETLINETAGFVFPACSPDFGLQLAQISEDIINLLGYPYILLNARPVIETIRVLYGEIELRPGREQDGGQWYYDEYNNSINFYNLDFAPESDGESVRVIFDIDDGYTRQ
jgi:hypothetical protein